MISGMADDDPLIALVGSIISINTQYHRLHSAALSAIIHRIVSFGQHHLQLLVAALSAHITCIFPHALTRVGACDRGAVRVKAGSAHLPTAFLSFGDLS